jgi:hypothetical protein
MGLSGLSGGQAKSYPVIARRSRAAGPARDSVRASALTRSDYVRRSPSRILQVAPAPVNRAGVDR